MNYAYHVDADELGDFLAERMTAAGVTHIRENVVDVQWPGLSNSHVLAILFCRAHGEMLGTGDQIVKGLHRTVSVASVHHEADTALR